MFFLCPSKAFFFLLSLATKERSKEKSCAANPTARFARQTAVPRWRHTLWCQIFIAGKIFDLRPFNNTFNCILHYSFNSFLAEKRPGFVVSSRSNTIAFIRIEQAM